METRVYCDSINQKVSRVKHEILFIITQEVYCKDPFCAEHRLPEEHRCVKLTQIRATRFGEKKVIRDGGRDKPNIFKRIFSRFKD